MSCIIKEATEHQLIIRRLVHDLNLIRPMLIILHFKGSSWIIIDIQWIPCCKKHHENKINFGVAGCKSDAFILALNAI